MHVDVCIILIAKLGARKFNIKLGKWFKAFCKALFASIPTERSSSNANKRRRISKERDRETFLSSHRSTFFRSRSSRDSRLEMGRMMRWFARSLVPCPMLDRGLTFWNTGVALSAITGLIDLLFKPVCTVNMLMKNVTCSQPCNI